MYSSTLSQDIVETEIPGTSIKSNFSNSIPVFSDVSPCDDSLLNMLKTKELLTQAEVYYKTQKEKECMSYSDSLKEAIQDSISKPVREASWQKKKQGIIAGIVLGVLAQILLFAVVISSGGDVWISTD
jgi:hypothetical protein